MNVDQVAMRLRERGVRLTAQRRAVLQVVVSAGRQLSAAAIHELGRHYEPELSLATVYRTLDLLASLDMVRPLRSPSGAMQFAAATLPHSHHVVCRSCGCAAEFEGCDIGHVVRHAARQTGFRIDGHWLELAGHCAACAAQLERN